MSDVSENGEPHLFTAPTISINGAAQVLRMPAGVATCATTRRAS